MLDLLLPELTLSTAAALSDNHWIPTPDHYLLYIALASTTGSTFFTIMCTNDHKFGQLYSTEQLMWRPHNPMNLKNQRWLLYGDW